MKARTPNRPRSRSGRRAAVKAGAGRVEFKTTQLQRCSEKKFKGGVILRLFADAFWDGCPEEVAAVVQNAVSKADQRVGAVLLPGGMGRLTKEVTCEGGWWDSTGVSTVNALAGEWCTSLSACLGKNHPPVISGLDGTVVFQRRRGRRKCDLGIQLTVAIEPRKPPHAAWKSTPVSGAEENCIFVPWNDAEDRPRRSAVRRNRAVGTVAGESSLFLICHDLSAFSSAQWLPRAPETHWKVRLRRQYVALLKAKRPSMAFSCIHVLPRGEEEDAGLPSSFKNGLNRLKMGRMALAGYRQTSFPPVSAVAVAGLHHGASSQQFHRVARWLETPFAHVDLRITRE